MPKQIIRSTFEQLEQLGKSTAKQVVQQPKKMAEEASSAVAGKKDEGGAETNPKGLDEPRHPKGVGSQPKFTQAQIAQKIEKAAQMRSKLHLQEIEGQIAQIQKQRLEQIKRVQEEVFKEKEEQKEPPEVQLPSKRKKGLMVSVKRLKQKVESFRGTSG